MPGHDAIEITVDQGDDIWKGELSAELKHAMFGDMTGDEIKLAMREVLREGLRKRALTMLSAAINEQVQQLIESGVNWVD